MNELDAVRDRYKKIYETYRNEQQRKADLSKSEIDKSADSDAQQAYIAWMQNDRKLPSDLARMGLSGGASETSLLKSKANYETRKGDIAKNRMSNKSRIDENLRSNLTGYKLTLDEQQEAALDAARERIRQAQLREEQRFASTVSGYDDINEIDKFLAYIKRSGVAPWRADYLRARRAELVKEQAQAAAAAAASASRSSGGSKGGSYATTNTTSNTSRGTNISSAVTGARNAIATGSATRSAISSIMANMKKPGSTLVPYHKIKGA
jgi:hypothetical protein